MTTTDSRQMRLLISGILTGYGISNLELEIKLVEAIKQMLVSPTPAHTREDILRSMQIGAEHQNELDGIADEIRRRVRINPTTRDWQDFIGWAHKQGTEQGQTITKFLDWWLSDEWQMTHPPTRPDGWYVKWPQAFKENSGGMNPQALEVGL